MAPRQRQQTTPPADGVLAALPRTRPQRASARRAAARERDQSQQAATTPETATEAKPAGNGSASKRKPKAAGVGPAERKRPGAEPRTGTSAGRKTATAGTAPKKATAEAARKTATDGATSNRAARGTVTAETARKTAAARGKVTAARVPSRPPRRTAKPSEPPAPKQGYEPEEEVEVGKTVDPPSGGELLESLADIFGELASAGASAGGRLLKDALSVFRRP